MSQRIDHRITDEVIRAFGFVIHHRPKDGQALWTHPARKGVFHQSTVERILNSPIGEDEMVPMRRNTILEEFRTCFGRTFIFWCPGCKEPHSIDIREDGVGHKFNEVMEKPSFSPGIVGKKGVCYLTVKYGFLQYGKCTHNLTSSTIKMVPMDLPQEVDGSTTRS